MTDEIDGVDLRTLTTITEYGVRDFSGEIVTMPDWRSPADVVFYLDRLGYSEDAYAVLARTTTTTVTTTGWEAAS